MDQLGYDLDLTCGGRDRRGRGRGRLGRGRGRLGRGRGRLGRAGPGGRGHDSWGMFCRRKEHMVSVSDMY